VLTAWSLSLIEELPVVLTAWSWSLIEELPVVLTPCSWSLIEELPVVQLLKNSQNSTEREGLFLCSQVASTGPYHPILY
jgi:hypothetical protein